MAHHVFALALLASLETLPACFLACPTQLTEGSVRGSTTRTTLRSVATAAAAQKPQVQGAKLARGARQLSSQELNSLLHSQPPTLQQRERLQGEAVASRGRRLWQAADPAAPTGPQAAAASPADAPVLDGETADLSGSGSSLYVVTTTGLEVDASNAGALPRLQGLGQCDVGRLQGWLLP